MATTYHNEYLLDRTAMLVMRGMIADGKQDKRCVVVRGEQT